jgi:acetoacetyl-CoA synthetase
MLNESVLWQPSTTRGEASALHAFAKLLRARKVFDWGGNVNALWQWSINNKADFWNEVWDFAAVIGDKQGPTFVPGASMRQAQFFPEARINFTENCLRNADQRAAVIAFREDGARQEISRAALKASVDRLANWFSQAGLKAGDRVAAYMPNCPETLVIMLATAALGGVFSSCSTDFGAQGVLDRFQQITPKFLFAADGYHYGGRPVNRLGDLAEVVSDLPSVERLVVVPYLDPEADISALAQATVWAETQKDDTPVSYHRGLFNDPLYILYSSGTTGRPKCITHGVGGTLLQHLKEYLLHADISAGDRAFYFTTCGWMMWNWLMTMLAVEATIILYDGNPAYPDMARLWRIAAEERLSFFGTSAKYIDSLRKAEFKPAAHFDLSHLKTISSTGSPLAPEGFAYVYEAIKKDVHLASISGGTDIVSCFALGSPVLPVRAGRLQMRGLGMDVEVWDDAGQAVYSQPGELVCKSAFPSQPVGFWNDPTGEAYKAAYYDYFPNVWRHGDWASLYASGELEIHGRSDTTLNPGGVRIGTAEIYRIVENFPQILESVVVGRPAGDDQEVVLFLRLADGQELDAALQAALRQAIREKASPRHVPALIVTVPDIPRTRSGKISEIAIRNCLMGREVTNQESLQNPEALDFYIAFRA